MGNELLKRKEIEKITLQKQKQWTTSISSKLKQEDILARELREKRKHKKMELREKMYKYAEMIKELKPINISEEKVSELKLQIEKLKHPVRKTKNVKKDYDISKVIPQNSQTMTSNSHENRSELSGAISIESPKAKLKSNLVNRKLRKSCELRRKPRPANLQAALKDAIRDSKNDGRKSEKKDYLSEFRSKKNPTPDIYKSALYNWEEDINNSRLSDHEKYSRIVSKANLIEERAKMKEKIMLAKGGAAKNYELGECVSDMLLDAIRAKLTVLEQL
jgi:hypothetical protein